jgi:uncharacterized protein (TIGR02145 family)
MKPNLFFSLLALPLMFLAGCSSDNDAGNSSSGKLPQVTLHVNNSNNASTRTQLDASGNITWATGDMINVNGAASTGCVLSNSNTTANFTVNAAAPYYAIYPVYSDLAYSSTNKTFSFTFPSTQTYSSDVSFANGVNPSVGYSASSTTFEFYNLCGMLRVPIVTNTVATKARFVSIDKPVSGSATATISTGTLTNSTITVSGTTMTMDITNLPSTSGYILNFVLPPATYGAGWAIELLDASGNVLVKKTSNADLSIVRSQITSVSTAVNLKVGVYSGSLYWALGNLIEASPYSTYTFESTQQAYTGTSAGGDYWAWNTLGSQTVTSTNTGSTYLSSTDPCTKVAPAGTWRMPTSDELTVLMNSGKVWGAKSGVSGYYFGTTTVPTANVESYVFLPASGYRGISSTSMAIVGSLGHYWASTPSGTANAYRMYFDSTIINVAGGDSRSYGFNVRCVSQ